MTQLIDNKRTRFKDAPWFDKKYTITVGGAGGIGSWLIPALARMGHSMEVFDFDTIEETNLAGQNYGTSDIGELKVDAIKYNSKYYSGEDLVTPCERFEETSMVYPICFSCFDNMEARKNMFNNWTIEALEGDKEAPCVFIDGRLLYGNIQVYVVTRDNIEQYKADLFDDSEVAPESCTLKVTTHYAMIIAGLMASMFTNYLSNYITSTELYPTPYAFKMELTSMYEEIIWMKK